MADWTTKDMPAQDGRSAVVTGTGGLGFETALALAGAGADVVLAGRSAEKGAASVAAIRARHPQAKIAFEELDLADLGSIDAFAARLARRPRLDLLINNAGVMTPPDRRVTKDGFELQFGTNYLGHFALTAKLMPWLMRGQAPRVVSLASIAARRGAIQFDDLQAEHGYRPMPVYAQSKLACLMFAFELQRRSLAGGWGVRSLAAHPGISRTDLLPNGAGASSASGLARRWLWFLFQPAAQGALPALYAATAPEAEGGGYYGPDRLGGLRGHPAPTTPPLQSRDESVAAMLWHLSERLTSSRFPPSLLGYAS